MGDAPVSTVVLTIPYLPSSILLYNGGLTKQEYLIKPYKTHPANFIIVSPHFVLEIVRIWLRACDLFRVVQFLVHPSLPYYLVVLIYAAYLFMVYNWLCSHIT